MRSFTVSSVVAGFVVSCSTLLAFQSPSRTILDGVYSEAQVRRAEPLYAARCASCHGADLANADVPLTGPRFTANYRDLSLELLSQRIRLTMPLDTVGSLTRAQSTDLVALILKRAGAPAGPEDLSAMQDVLQRISYVSVSEPVPVALRP